MNCELIQRRLLASDSPGSPSAETRRHLAECPACRVWQRRLAQLEAQLPALATPPSQRRAAVMAMILNAPAPAERNGTTTSSSPRRLSVSPTRERGLRKVSVAIALAAALAVFVIGWLLLPPPPKTTAPADPLAAHRATRDELLAQAPTRQAKVETLAKLADQYHDDVLKLAQQDDSEKLANHAKFYVELVTEDLPQQAAALAKETPPGERKEALGVIRERADHLERTESNINQLLAGPAKMTVQTRTALKQMASAARKGQDHLLTILRGEA